MTLAMHQNVIVNGTPGYITGIYPNGKGQYHGPQHAFYWVRQPSLDYTEMYPKTRLIKWGCAVGFNEMHRIKEVSL